MLEQAETRNRQVQAESAQLKSLIQTEKMEKEAKQKANTVLEQKKKALEHQVRQLKKTNTDLQHQLVDKENERSEAVDLFNESAVGVLQSWTPTMDVTNLNRGDNSGSNPEDIAATVRPLIEPFVVQLKLHPADDSDESQMLTSRSECAVNMY